jgi:hypothetical protein
MSSLFFHMLAGHLIADLWLQPTNWVNHRKEYGWKSNKLAPHVLLASILPVVFTLRIDLWWFIPVIFVTHYLIDILKSHLRDNIFYFILDQSIHIAILVALVVFSGGEELSEGIANFWIFASGFILVTTPMGFLTGLFFRAVTKAESNMVSINASAWIGIFERILIVIFVVTGQLQAIGFLVAAKSIFRFSDTQKDNNLKAEYFLLGTLVSFTLAVIAGVAIKFLINIY